MAKGSEGLGDADFVKSNRSSDSSNEPRMGKMEESLLSSISFWNESSEEFEERKDIYVWV